MSSTVSVGCSPVAIVKFSVPFFREPLPYEMILPSPPLGMMRTSCIIRSPINTTEAVESSIWLIDIVTLHTPSGRVSQGASLYSVLDSVDHVPVSHFLRLAKKLEVHSGSYPSMIGFPDGIYIVLIASGGVFSVTAPLQRVSICTSFTPSSY